MNKVDIEFTKNMDSDMAFKFVFTVLEIEKIENDIKLLKQEYYKMVQDYLFKK